MNAIEITDMKVIKAKMDDKFNIITAIKSLGYVYHTYNNKIEVLCGDEYLIIEFV